MLLTRMVRGTKRSTGHQTPEAEMRVRTPLLPPVVVDALHWLSISTAAEAWTFGAALQGTAVL